MFSASGLRRSGSGAASAKGPASGEADPEWLAQSLGDLGIEPEPALPLWSWLGAGAEYAYMMLKREGELVYEIGRIEAHSGAEPECVIV